ncbi:hypothetical protein BGZ83_006246 [Gryganskiella cystojenkinii]|nr:hypothetical protein BGZ83_006246 [Gryganskiella cystojenkinii]
MANQSGPDKGSLPHRRGSNSSASKAVKDEDSTAIFVKIIEDQLPWYKRPNALWLLPIFGLSSISTGMLTSSIGQYHASLLCREYLSRHSSASSLSSMAVDGLFQAMTRPAVECQVPEIQAFTAKTLAMIEVIGGLASMFSIGYYSSLSDRHGRLNLIALQFVNTLLMLTATFLMGVYWDQFGLTLMVFSGLLTGLLGGSSMGLGLTMCLAYAADCTDPAKRSLIFSYLHSGLYFGLSVGPFLGGVLVKHTGTIMSIVSIDVCITLASLLLTVFVIPESLPIKQPAEIQLLLAKMTKKDDILAKDSTATTTVRAAWHAHVTQPLAFFRPNGRNTNLVLLAAISFLQNLAVRGTLSVIILYTNQIFHWGEYEDGFLFSIGNIVRFVTLLGILPILVHYYKKAAAKKIKRKASAAALEEARIQQLQQKQQQRQSAIFSSMLDPNVTSSVQSLGEAALDNLDHSGGPSSVPSSFEDEQGAFMDPRHRQASVDSFATLKAPSPSTSSSPRIPDYSSNIDSNLPSNGKRPATAERNESTLSVTTRTKEQTFSDMKFDTWMIRLGFAINSITYLGYGLAKVGWVFYLAVALHALSIVSSPSLKSLLTNLVEPSQFGAVLGAIQVVDSISAVCSPIVISWVYALTVSTMPEFVWYSCAGFTGICVILSFMIRQKQFRQNIE